MLSLDVTVTLLTNVFGKTLTPGGKQQDKSKMNYQPGHLAKYSKNLPTLHLNIKYNEI